MELDTHVHGAPYADPWRRTGGRMHGHTPTHELHGIHPWACPHLRTMPRSSTYVPSHGCVRCLDRARMCLPMAAYDASLVHVRAFVVPRTTFVGPRTCLRGAAYDASLVHVCAFVVPRTSFGGPPRGLCRRPYDASLVHVGAFVVPRTMPRGSTWEPS